MEQTAAKKIFITVAIGCCQRRLLDTTRLAQYFKRNDYLLVDSPACADYIILMTCSFSKARENDCFRAIDKFSKYKAELIVVGCLPEMEPLRFRQKFKGKAVSTKDLSGIERYFSSSKVKFLEVPDTHLLFNKAFYRPSSAERFLRQFELSKRFYKKCAKAITVRIKHFLSPVDKKSKDADTPAYLRISHGCLEHCAYCSMRNAIGPLKSKPLSACGQQYRSLLQQGYRKFVFLADNLGAYGLDIHSSFAEVLAYLSEVDKGTPVSWELDELHPKWAIKYQAEILKLLKERKIVKMMCASQSGSDRILKLMNRGNTSLAALEVFLAFKAANPSLILQTQVIVGFPSESEEDFLATLQFVKKVHFDVVNLFPYLDGYGTIASKMTSKIDAKTIRSRIIKGGDFLDKEKVKWSYPIEGQ